MPRLLVGEGEVAAGGEDLGVLQAQEPRLAGEDLLPEADGLGGASGLLEDHGEVAPHREGVEVVRAQDASAVGRHPFQ